MTASPPAFALLLTALSIYLATGLVTAIGFLIAGNRGLGVLDSHALSTADGRTTIAFRAIIFPGLVVLWPLVLLRFTQTRRQAGSSFTARRRERPPHISRRHRVSTFLLLIFLPPLFVLAVLQGRSDGPPAIAAIDSEGTRETTQSDAVAGAHVSIQFDAAYVPRLELTLVVRRTAANASDAARYWLHTSPGEDPLPPDTLLYWLPSPASQNDGAEHDSPEITDGDARQELNAAYLLGPLPAGPGRLPFPDNAKDSGVFEANPGFVFGYSLAHQKILFRIRLSRHASPVESDAPIP